jgi:hypothetical protein
VAVVAAVLRIEWSAPVHIEQRYAVFSQSEYGSCTLFRSAAICARTIRTMEDGGVGSSHHRRMASQLKFLFVSQKKVAGALISFIMSSLRVPTRELVVARTDVLFNTMARRVVTFVHHTSGLHYSVNAGPTSVN